MRASSSRILAACAAICSSCQAALDLRSSKPLATIGIILGRSVGVRAGAWYRCGSGLSLRIWAQRRSEMLAGLGVAYFVTPPSTGL